MLKLNFTKDCFVETPKYLSMIEFQKMFFRKKKFIVDIERYILVSKLYFTKKSELLNSNNGDPDFGEKLNELLKFGREGIEIEQRFAHKSYEILDIYLWYKDFQELIKWNDGREDREDREYL